ncbi:MAG: PrsW family glutamic-type intramembrane protease, partial [Candidatus Paceibacteria bacterium]
ATLVAGAVLGYGFTAFVGGALAQLDLSGDSADAFVLAGLAIPILGQALMLAGPLFLYVFRSRLREPLDGLTFGAASALGFTLASSLTKFWPLIAGPALRITSPLNQATYPDGIVTITGQASRIAMLTLDGAQLLHDKDGSFSTTLTFPAGESILTFVATDRFGRRVTATRSIFVPITTNP